MRIFQKYALELDTSKIVFSGSTTQIGLKNEFSVVLWLKWSGVYSDTPAPIVFTRGVYKNDGFYVWYSDKIKKVDFCNIGPNFGFPFSVSLDEMKKWHMLGVVYGEGVAGVYYGSELRDLGETRTKVQYHKPDRDIVIGNYLSGRYWWNGLVGEVRVYNRPLTEEEIEYLYKGGHIEDGLVFWLYPDEDSVVLDSDGVTVLKVYDKVNGYEGTAYNGVKLVSGKDVEVGGKFLLVRKV